MRRAKNEKELESGMIKLGVNIDHVATVRQARGIGVPDLKQAARAAMSGGADGITIHLREDRRHIQDLDVKVLIPEFRVNLEMASTAEMLGIALADPRPHSVCLVPEKREELTTEGGLDVAAQTERLKKYIEALKNEGVIVSLFVDPDRLQIEACAAAGADFIELHTGSWANNPVDEEKDKLYNGARRAQELGLRVNAGHGLDTQNVHPILKLDGLEELNIGFSIVARGIFIGLENAVREMKQTIEAG